MKNINPMLLAIGVSFLSVREVDALTISELQEYSLNAYPEVHYGSDEMNAFLKEKGVSLKDYNEYLTKLNKYSNSKEYLWERLENGSILIDEILFSDPLVRKEYNKAYGVLGSDMLAYDHVKKNLLNDPDSFAKIFNEALEDSSILIKAFKQKFNRKPYNSEIECLKDKNKLKIAMYSGYLGYSFTQQDFDMIYENDEGYKVLGLKEKDIKNYMEFLKVRNEYNSLLMEYIRSTSMFESISTEVRSIYSVDMFKYINREKRLNIYDKSLKGFIFDEEKAMELVLKELVSKGVISKEDIDQSDKEDEEDYINQENGGNNPWNDLESYKNKRPSKKPTLSLAERYKASLIEHVYQNLKDEYIYVKYKDKEFNTYIRTFKDDTIATNMFEKLLSMLKEELGLERIYSKKEVLLFLDNSVETAKFKSVSEKPYKFSEVVKLLDKVGIELYTKKIDFDAKEESDQTDTNNKFETSQAVFDFNDKKVVINDVFEKKITMSHITTILNALGCRSIFSVDSALILKDNELIVSKNLSIRDFVVTIDKAKKFFNDIGEEVNIYIIDNEG